MDGLNGPAQHGWHEETLEAPVAISEGSDGQLHEAGAESLVQSIPGSELMVEEAVVVHLGFRCAVCGMVRTSLCSLRPLCL